MEARLIDAVIQRLAEDCAALKTVKGAVDFANIMESQFNVPLHERPAAFVMLAGEQARPNELDTGGVAQIVTEQVQIAMCVGDGKPAGATIAGDAVKSLRDAVMDCLLGWSPDELGVLTYGGLRMLAFRPRAVWFEMIFARQVGVSG